ncbi:MAG TPA: DUF6457 domain-containing protein [Acidimicrobiales bacterium]|nr:DUF6457 domain-containing protein [Acidimicrobiales bacterium]
MSDVRTWLQEFAGASGGHPLDEVECETILALAGVAAHSSERTAAPLTCWVAARAGLSPSEALAVARSLADHLATTDQGLSE